MPFQFSLHIQKEEGGEKTHKQYLAENKSADLLFFVEELLLNIGNIGSVLVYNKAFENFRLRELKEHFTQYEEAISVLQDRLVDLMTPFRTKQYYLPEVEGSNSIKQVMSAFITELRYDDLLIRDRGEASTAFYNLDKCQDERIIAEIRLALLKYSEFDTLIMVKILEKLQDV